MTNIWWVSGGYSFGYPYPVTLNLSLTFSNGQHVVVSERGLIDMFRPQAAITPATSTVTVLSGAGLMRFGILGYPGTEGITFYHTITIPAGFTGADKWVQTISSFVRKIQSSDSTWYAATNDNPAPYLDTSFPYSKYLGTNAVDAPRIGMISSDLRGVADDSFVMWMMFQPEGGVLVPLRAVNWYWRGSCTNGPSGWGLESSPGDHSVNPADFDTQNYPYWNHLFTTNDLHWVETSP